MGLDQYLSDGPGEGATEVAYFRKFNALHAWVERLVGHESNCEVVKIAGQDLDDLRLDVEAALEGEVGAFPTRSGFFFGSTDYDEWYQKDLKKLQKVLDGRTEIYYNSSW
jgi:hypothetical protein